MNTEAYVKFKKDIVNNCSRIIVGKDEVIEQLALCLIASGHVLLEDVPGTGKTMLLRAFAATVGGSFKRIQFTPDLLPSDLTGINFYNQKTSEFQFRPGPLFSNLVLADEINRATPRTQSALLEAMAERQVTVDGNTYPLQKPFIVIATQNNVGTAGTQMLPYAQMDRFLVRLSIGYPDYDAQMELLKARQDADPLEDVRQSATREDVQRMQREVRAVSAKDSILSYLTRLALASREHPMTEIGISPRGVLFIDRMAKACAYLQGRDYVIPEDVQAVFADVCTHRVILTQKARLTGVTAEQVLSELLRCVEVPDTRCD